jgi:Fe-S cluster assembly scaffold protein SufB
LECDAIIDGTAPVDASPKPCAHHSDAALIHEAAIGKIAGEQILELRTLGLTEDEAETEIIEGFPPAEFREI